MFETRADFFKCLLKQILIIFSSEYAIMIFLDQLHLESNLNNFVDAVTLSLFSGTLIYFIIAKPMILKSAKKQFDHMIEVEKLSYYTQQIEGLNETAIVAITDVKGKIKYVNEMFCNISGYTSQELVGKDHRLINSGYHSKEFFKELWTTIRAGKIWTGEIKNKTKKGEFYWVDTKIIPIKNSAGEPVDFLVFRNDITEKKKTDVLYREMAISSQQRLEELSAVYSLSNAVGSADTLEDVYIAAKSSILRSLRADRVSILLFDQNGVMRFQSWDGLSEEYRKLADGHSPWTQDAVNPTPVLIEDITLDADWAHFQPVAAAEGIRAFGFIPLMQQGRLLGKFMVYFNQPHRFTESEIQLANTIAFHIAFAIDRKKSDQKLLISESNYRNVVDNIQEVIFKTDPQGRWIFLNKAWENLLGYSLKESMGQLCLNYVHPEDRHLHGELFQNLIQHKTEYCRHEIRYVKQNNETCWVEVYAKIGLNEQNEIIGTYGTLMDITERKAAAEKQELAASVFENSYEGIVITNANNVIIKANPAATRITGYSADEIVGQTPHRLASGKHDSEFYSKMWLSLNEKYFWNGEIWNQRKNGEIYPEMLSISVTRDKSGKIRNYIGIFSDITVTKQYELSLIEARRNAEAATIAKSRFLAIMSHEIRTPMNGILGMAQLLQLPTVSESERQEYSQTILNSGTTLLSLLNDILDISKIESGKIELESVAFEPMQLIEEIKVLFSEAVSRKSLRLESRWIGQPDQRYLSDPYRIRQIILNLVSNAIKFTEQGEILIVVKEIERTGSKALLEFSVFDSGIGIPKEQLTLLFKPFSQADNSTTRKYGGTGLGLSIVSGLASLLGGQVGVDSEIGKGSRFWFRISADVTTNKIETKTTSLESNHNFSEMKGRVLVVDDEPVNRRVAQIMLMKLGLTVSLAENGKEALDIIKAGEQIDLILMDVQMPVMDGYLSTQKIRQFEMEHNIPRHLILALTANAFEEDHQQCLKSDMDDVIVKPVSIKILKEKIPKSIHLHE